MGKTYRTGMRRVAAAAISVVMVIGLSGCDAFSARKSKNVMKDKLQNFNKALNDLDYETARSLTDWTEEDGDYEAIVGLFDTSYYGASEGNGFIYCTEYIASTISLKYDISEVQIQNDQASLDVVYEMVDWTKVYKEPHDSYDQILEDLKNCPDKFTFNTVIIFENVDGKGDWRLCKLYDLGKVMSFVYTLPEIPD